MNNREVARSAALRRTRITIVHSRSYRHRIPYLCIRRAHFLNLKGKFETLAFNFKLYSTFSFYSLNDIVEYLIYHSSNALFTVHHLWSLFSTRNFGSWLCPCLHGKWGLNEICLLDKNSHNHWASVIGSLHPKTEA